MQLRPWAEHIHCLLTWRHVMSGPACQTAAVKNPRPLDPQTPNMIYYYIIDAQIYTNIAMFIRMSLFCWTEMHQIYTMFMVVMLIVLLSKQKYAAPDLCCILIREAQLYTTHSNMRTTFFVSLLIHPSDLCMVLVVFLC